MTLLHPRVHDVGMGRVAMSVVLPSDAELASLEGRELDEALWGLEQIRRKVEHATGLVVGRCDRTGHFVADGHRSPRGWAMAVTNCSPGGRSFSSPIHERGQLLRLRQ